MTGVQTCALPIFARPFPNEKAARAANNGAYPVDLSMVVKARVGGPDYVYGVLTGYTAAPAGVTLMDGMNYNAYFPGHQIAMPAPINVDGVTYQDGTKASIEQQSKDVVTFLTWASEPTLEARKQMGVKVLLFLIVDRKSTRLNSSHIPLSRMPSSA